MGWLSFIVLGGLAGWLASIVMHTNGSQGIILNVIVGVVGASVGGYLFNWFGGAGVTGFNLYSLMVATVGAVVLIWFFKLIRG
jgi:uncharacterized membrane protein YeaQ/YmgE (transglycosylase-associated protein family)